MFNAKNLLVDIGGAKIPCAVFGKGKKNLTIKMMPEGINIEDYR